MLSSCDYGAKFLNDYLLSLPICLLTIGMLNNMFNNWYQCAYFFVD